MKVAFFDDDSKRVIVFGPFPSVENTGNMIKVPINFNAMDEEAERFFCEAHSIGISPDNLLAVRQNGGTWELRELAGKWAYEVFENVSIVGD